MHRNYTFRAKTNSAILMFMSVLAIPVSVMKVHYRVVIVRQPDSYALHGGTLSGSNSQAARQLCPA